MGIECSAKNYLKLIDLVFCAQRVVLFPINPIYDTQDQKLTPAFVWALKRIFWIADQDNDGYLNDKELSDLQKEVFKGNLNKNHIEGLKELLWVKCPEYKEDRYSDSGITFEAFKALQLVFIHKLKI